MIDKDNEDRKIKMRDKYINKQGESEVAQSSPTLCDPMDCSLSGSSVHGIFQARVLEWIAISFSNAWKWKLKVKSLSRVRPSWPHRLQPIRLLCPWDFPGKSTGVGCHRLLRRASLEKCKSKLQWGITSHQSEWPSSNSLQTIYAGEDVKKKEPSYTIGGNVNWCSYCEEQYGGSLKN